MAHRNQFFIRNDLAASLILNIEPEGAFFPLARGEEVSVTDVFVTTPVTLKLTNSEKGDTILSIWPGDGKVVIEQDKVDVLDLLQNSVEV